VIDDGMAGRLNSAASSFSASAMPTALVMPWPSGPVVVSTPAVWPYSGWPGRLAAELAEVLQVRRGQVVAGQVQQRVEQHRAVAVGEHETVAVGPLRDWPGCAQVARHSTSAISPCPSGRPGAGVGFLDGVHGIKDPRHLRAQGAAEFVKAGAPEEILYVSKPHIGTFRLVGMVETMRAEIIALGGEIRFQSG
jgi:hypothetical protein